MLEKIGLPPKPSLRENTWVVDASHCQGCHSQFTFINRKHHCRRCGGLFCNTCTQQRMLLRGQGDSPARICEPCKKSEEAARYEKRQGLKNRSNRGSSSSTSRQGDEVLNQIIGNNGPSGSLAKGSNNDVVFNNQRAIGSLSHSHSTENSNQEKSGSSNDDLDKLGETGSSDPYELHQQALEEKKKSKILKGEGKSEEALRAFKRSKQLERQAEALEKRLRRSHRKVVYSGDISLSQNRDDVRENNRKPDYFSGTNKGKDDLASELRELGWTDMDLHDEDRKPKSLSLEGELYSLISESSAITGSGKGIQKIDKTQVNVLKKNALVLKRDGKLTEAKEELKRAKILEKQLEEQELLAAAEDSDDELSALIREMDNDKEERFDSFDKQGLGFDPLVGADADFVVDMNFEVTDKDMHDPELDATLKSLGWTEEPNHPDDILLETPVDQETLLSEIQSLKREALHKKRAGNAAEAMALLKKAKVLERDLASTDSQGNNSGIDKNTFAEKSGNLESMISEQNTSGMKEIDHAITPKSRLMIQRELLSLKKNALSLRREGRIKEADEVLRKGSVLELQLEEMDRASKTKATGMRKRSSGLDSVYETSDIDGDLSHTDLGEDDITDNDMSDPTYLKDLKDLGWTDDGELSNSPIERSKQDHDQFVPSKVVSAGQAPSSVIHKAQRKHKTEIQRELLGLKRKALALRREGKVENAEEVLKMAKELEAKMETDTTEKETKIQASKSEDQLVDSLANSAVQEGTGSNATDEDLREPALQSMLTNLGWKVEELKPVSRCEQSSNVSTYSIGDSRASESSSRISKRVQKSKGEIQRELLAIKREALALRRKGELEEAEEILKKAKVLEAQMDEFEASENENALNNSETMKAVAHKNAKEATMVDKGNIAELPIGSIINTSAAGHSTSTMDLLSGDYFSSWEMRPQTGKELGSGSEKLFDGHSPADMESMVTTEEDEKPNKSKSNVVQELASQDNIDIHQEVLAHKRKALALKREGKLVEAREELRQAKLLEKRMNDGSSKAGPGPIDNSSSTTKNLDSSFTTPKPLSSRDRFKLQQESLSHKRHALKLRREGRTEEADKEFELAKALEIQLEELAAHDSAKSSASKLDAADVGTVEDFLDPQLLSALKAIGIEDANVRFSAPERKELVEPDCRKSGEINQERTQLEEQIKTERLKAVSLKRSGKQAEALDALRRAKLFEKKLNSLTS